MKTLLAKLPYYFKQFSFFTALRLFVNIECFHVSSLSLNGEQFFLRKNTSDHLVFFQVMVYESYIYIKKLGNIGVIIDAGANVGFASRYFAKRFRDAKIISIEPDPRNFKQLEKNTMFISNITRHQNALWKNRSMLSLDESSREEWSVKVTEQPLVSDGCSSLRVEAIGMSDIIDEYNLDYVDILKIDIEGAEMDLFSCNYERWLPRVKCIIIEFHEGYKKGCSTVVMKALSKFNFSIRVSRKENVVFVNNDLM